MKENHRNERIRPRILPAWLQAQVLNENPPPKADSENSKGELNEGRTHPEQPQPVGQHERDPTKKKTGEF